MSAGRCSAGSAVRFRAWIPASEPPDSGRVQSVAAWSVTSALPLRRPSSSRLSTLADRKPARPGSGTRRPRVHPSRRPSAGRRSHESGAADAVDPFAGSLRDHLLDAQRDPRRALGGQRQRPRASRSIAALLCSPPALLFAPERGGVDRRERLGGRPHTRGRTRMDHMITRIRFLVGAAGLLALLIVPVVLAATDGEIRRPKEATVSGAQGEREEAHGGSRRSRCNLRRRAAHARPTARRAETSPALTIEPRARGELGDHQRGLGSNPHLG